MKTAARFDHLDDAYSAVAVLHAHGIEAFLPDECTIGLYWPYCQAIGGIRVQVAAPDRERASEILAGAVVEALSPACPHCGSTRLRVMRFGAWSALAIGVGFCPPPAAVRYHCCACRKTFRAVEARRDALETSRLEQEAVVQPFVDASSDDWPRYLRFPLGAVVGAGALTAMLPVWWWTTTEALPLATSYVLIGLLGGSCACLIGLADDMRRKHFGSKSPGVAAGDRVAPE